MNIIKRTLALAVVVLMFTTSCMAASITSATYENGMLNVTTDGYTKDQEATILVLKSGVVLEEATGDDVVYVNQVTVGASSPSFSFPVSERAAELNTQEVQLFMGGTDINSVIEYKNSNNENSIVITSTPTVVTTYEATLSTTNFAYGVTEDTIKAAVVVKKIVTTDGISAAPEVITTGYTIAVDTTTKTVTVTFPDSTTGSMNYTTDAAPDGRTAIKGVVKYQLGTNYRVAQGALVLVTQGATIVGTAVTDANGAFDITVPAGTYKVIIRFARITSSSVINYANTIIDGVVVTENYVKNLTSADLDYVQSNIRLTGDANDDGKVDITDYNAVVTGIRNAAN